MERRKVLTIGEIVVEIMATEIGNGFLEPISLVGPFPSGAPAIFINQMALLDHPCSIISCVGEDDFGRINIDRLSRSGVDTTAIAVDPERVTGSAFVRYREDGLRDFVFNIRHSACGRLSQTPAAESAIASVGHLHVMGSSLYSAEVIELIATAVRRVKAQGGTVSFDPNIRKEMLNFPGMAEALNAILAQTDLFMPSGQERFLFSDQEDEDAAVDALLAGGVRAVIIKRGAVGASYFDRSGAAHVPGFAVEEIDPTGAGDTFGATFVAGWLDGVEPAVALKRANAAGALAVTKRGPMEGASTVRTLEDFMTEQEEALS